jgi:hypothetical protein
MLRTRLANRAAGGLYLRGCLARLSHTKSTEPHLEGKVFKEVRIGLPREVAEGEKRVAGTPESVALLVKKGFKVSVAEGAGGQLFFSLA